MLRPTRIGADRDGHTAGPVAGSWDNSICKQQEPAATNWAGCIRGHCGSSHGWPIRRPRGNMRRAAPPSCTVTCGQTTGQGWRLAVPGRDVMIRDWRGKAEDRHCTDRSPTGQHPIDGDSKGGLRSRAVCMKDPGPGGRACRCEGAGSGVAGGMAGRAAAANYEAARSVDRYLRVRAKHALAARPELWLGISGRGPVTPDGIYQIVAKVGKKAGVALYPHRFGITSA